MLLPVLRQSARANDQMQYRGQAAVNVSLNVVHGGASSYSAIADAILGNGKQSFQLTTPLLMCSMWKLDCLSNLISIFIKKSAIWQQHPLKLVVTQHLETTCGHA